MQKACEIIAIGAILLSASQFASAQTSPDHTPPPQTPPAADKSSALRDQVRDALQQAGFKNIRIITESFVVRAIDQNGDPVVMVIRPDSLRSVRAQTGEDADEANADEPGRPDPWADFSENDEEQATAPTPRGGHIGKSSKMTDRSPAAESDQQAQAGQNPGNGEAGNTANNTAKSAKMTDRQENSGAAEQLEAAQVPSQSAKMRDGSKSQGATNETIAGRSNGTMTQMKESAQGALELTAAQRAEIWQRLGKQQGTNAPPGFQPTVGATVPATMQLKTLPSSVLSRVPQIQSYNYAMLQSQLLIVDPATKKIVSIITE